MADATDRNDPTYSTNPNYVFTGGRWQYVPNREASEQAARPDPTRNPERITAVNVGTGGVLGDAFGVPKGPDQLVSPALLDLVSKFSSKTGGTVINSPFRTAQADAARADQMALYRTLQRQSEGPSLANLQGQQAWGRLGQQALSNVAVPGGARSALLQARGAGGQLTNDILQARLAEIMQNRAAQGSLIGGVRGSDIRTSTLNNQFARDARAATDQSAQAYSNLYNDALTALARIESNNRQANAQQLLGAKRATADATKGAVDTTIKVNSMGK